MGWFKKLKEPDQELDRYLEGYSKTKKGFGARLGALFGGFRGVSDEFLEKLTKTLLEADAGPDTTVKIVEAIRSLNKRKRIESSAELQADLIDQLAEIYSREPIAPIHYTLNGTTVILIVGVNGVGKTTTIAKLAKYYQRQHKSVVLAAGDTFRAGAREQLQLWANRLGLTCIAGKDQADPASVMVDACRYAKEHKTDILLCDTAGRFQNKSNLMQELEKIHRVIGKTIPGQPTECWLTIDATTGQNGLAQAKMFLSAAKITGIVLTKLDGTGKGGIILAVKDKLNVPVRFIGTGEGADDLQEFRIEAYLKALIQGIEDRDA